VHSGAAFTVDATTELASIVKEPNTFAGKTLKTTGKVARCCTKKGCWMELQPEAGDKGVRVTFKDYGFFVPLDAGGASATVEGQLTIRTLDKATADHLKEEGARIEENEKGEVVEIAMVASAVELTKAP